MENNCDIKTMYRSGLNYNKQKKYMKMIKCFEFAADHGHIMAMVRLGIYYHKQKNHPNLLKYYTMAVNCGNSNAMTNLGVYFNEQKDYLKSHEYYMMAIKLCNSHAMFNLALHYKEQKDFQKMINYYKLAIDHGNSNAMISLGNYYSRTKNYSNMIKYYVLAIEFGNIGYDLINDALTNHKLDNNLKYLLMCKKYINEQNMDNFTRLCIDFYDVVDDMNMNKQECCICYIETYFVTLKCHHSICFVCYDKINKCPLCRRDL